MPRLSISLGDFEKCMSPRAIDSVGKYIVRNLFLEIQFRESNLTSNHTVEIPKIHSHAFLAKIS